MIRVRGEGLVSRLSSARERFGRRVTEALTLAATRARQVAAGRAPGNLPGTLSAQMVNDSAVRVATSSPVALFTEAGTKPHPIAPKQARVLRFQVAGSTAFARVVMHPGNKAIHYMRDGAEAGKAELLRRLREIARTPFA